MTKAWKHSIASIGILAAVIGIVTPIQTYAEEMIEFTKEEENLVHDTQEMPIKIGIIPHAFPLSACPPEVADFMGVNVEMLNLITEKSGMQFEFCRVPTEKNTPYDSLVAGEFTLVAGTIKLDSFINNPDLILSDRFCDGSAACIAKRNTNPNIVNTGKSAVMSGYQAGVVFSQKQFPQHEVVLYPNNQEVVRAVRTGKADMAMISRYAGIYELQNPLNEDLEVLAPYQMIADSCIMGLNTPEVQTAMSIINKVLSQIGEDEYNHVQMNFSITHPYNMSTVQFLYKYRYLLMTGFAVFMIFTYLTAKLLSSQKDRRLLSKDPLTGAYTVAGFELRVGKIISKSNKLMFITDFDISHFSGYNELYGKEKGDELLKEIVRIVSAALCEQDAICRSYADNFKVLTCKDSMEELMTDIKKANTLFNQLVESRMIFHFGIYQVTDISIPISKMLDFAAMAKKKVKTSSDSFICVFDSKLHERHMSDARMLASFSSAMNNKEFIAYYQPKFDSVTQQICSAEALVRWIGADGKMKPPDQFIELFEKNGQIQKLDFYMLEQVCMLQKYMLEQGLPAIPISVNFSRVHLYSSDFTSKMIHIVSKHGIPNRLIEIECTETAMTDDTELSKDILGQLQKEGFTIAMDDFGKAYSSLNALRSMPLDIIKLDSGFLLATLEHEKERANKIISGMVALVHDLSLKIVAEGVETEEQYLFLKSLGCDYIQGYYFSRPLDKESFLKLLQ